MVVRILIAVLCLVNQVVPTSIHQLQPQITHQQSVTTTSSRSTGGVGSILAGFVLGPFLFFCALVCIWYNQKRAAIDDRRLKLAAEICEDVDVTSQASAMKQDGKLVYAHGQTRTSAIIRDPVSGVAGPNLIKISRQVEVLEWRRHTRRENDRDIEYQQLEWVSQNSTNQGSRFNNPANWFISNDITYNSQVYLGGYNIDKETADKCQKSIPFSPTLEHAQNILINTNRQDRTPNISGEYIYFTPQTTNMYYAQGMMSQGMGQGEGTLRVRFSLCPTGQITICARSTGATFSPFPIAEYEGTAQETNAIPECCCCMVSSCYAQLLKPIQHIHLVEQRSLGKGQMFELAVKKSECFTRGLRIGSYLLLVFSICLFFSPITTLLGYIPLLGGFISQVVAWAIFLAALIICIPIYIIMTSIAWLSFHPKVGIAILAIGLAILAGILIYNHSKQDSGSSGGTVTHFMTIHRYSHT